MTVRARSITVRREASIQPIWRTDLPALARPAAWRSQAACRDHPVDTFFPGSRDDAGTTAAAAICADCPVADECLDEALHTPGDLAGIRAGLTPRQREQERKRRDITPAYERRCERCGKPFTTRRLISPICSSCINVASNKRRLGSSRSSGAA